MSVMVLATEKESQIIRNISRQCNAVSLIFNKIFGSSLWLLKKRAGH